MHRLRGEHTQRTLDQNVGHQGNMIMDGTVRFTSEAGAKYGFTIRNTSPKALFPFLFYFDPDEYTIQEWYSPGRWLKSGETATIGSGAEQAFEFALLPGQHDSSGFLKLLMASDYVYPHWEQKSPFDEAFKPAELMTVRELLDRFKAIEWDALTVMLTMTAH
ncbi:hypothetical protein B0H19DRAFT_1162092 [Mycena capillaripes]|nr:hypothetical protein B0H19DRAFT_1162092 [Mycena capillaripes]